MQLFKVADIIGEGKLEASAQLEAYHGFKIVVKTLLIAADNSGVGHVSLYGQLDDGLL